MSVFVSCHLLLLLIWECSGVIPHNHYLQKKKLSNLQKREQPFISFIGLFYTKNCIKLLAVHLQCELVHSLVH